MEIFAGNGTVLIVDDTPGNLALLSDMLSEANYRVLVATDGQSALEQIQYIRPDIILLDVMMPGIDGFETCSRMKADPLTAAIPILFMTGLSELDHLLRGFDEGAVDYIVKPIRPAEVLARIEVHLSQTRNLRRAESLLANADFAALAINSAGRINWMTPAAATWFRDFNLTQGLAQEYRINDFLPSTLLNWFQSYRDHHGVESGEQQLATNFSASINVCAHPDEFMLLLRRDAITDEWSPQALQEKLKLTVREAEILMWIARGKTNKEIGIILSTSPRTVNKHLEHVFEKLGVSTRAAAVAMALKSSEN